MSGLRYLLAFVFGMALIFFPESSFAADQVLSLSPVKDLTSQGILVICLMVLILVVLLKEYAPPDIALFFGGIIFCLTEVISFDDFLKGFSTPTLLTLAMLFIFMKSMEINGVMDWVSSYIVLNTPKRSIQILGICLPVMFLSTVFGNTSLALFYTPFVRRWALERNLYPSEFLIPVVFSSLLGSNLTLMGSSSNLVVEALLENTKGAAVFHFFSIAPLGILVASCGLLFITTVGYRLLPKRQVPAGPFNPSYSVVLELRIDNNCLLLDHSLGLLGETYLRNVDVLEIRRGDRVLLSPGPDEEFQVDDTLLLFGEVSRLLQLKKISGLVFVQDSQRRFDFSSAYFFEAILATVSEFVGRTLREMQFKEQFGATVVAIYREGKRVEEKLADLKLQAGDVFFLLSGESLWEKESVQRNFFLIRNSPAQESISLQRAGMTVAILLIMVLIAYLTGSMLHASCFAVLSVLGLKLIDLRNVRKSIQWDLLIQVGSGMVYSKALTVSGVASWVAYHIQPMIGQSPHAFVAFIFMMTMLLAQVITPTACVLIVYPIALTMSSLSGFSGVGLLGAIGAALSVAASTCFLSPIGHPANMIIYGPGGYKFGDFARIGLPLTLIVALICILFIPYWWPIISY